MDKMDIFKKQEDKEKNSDRLHWVAVGIFCFSVICFYVNIYAIAIDGYWEAEAAKPQVAKVSFLD